VELNLPKAFRRTLIEKEAIIGRLVLARDFRVVTRPEEVVRRCVHMPIEAHPRLYLPMLTVFSALFQA